MYNTGAMMATTSGITAYCNGGQNACIASITVSAKITRYHSGINGSQAAVPG